MVPDNAPSPFRAVFLYSGRKGAPSRSFPTTAAEDKEGAGRIEGGREKGCVQRMAAAKSSMDCNSMSAGKGPGQSWSGEQALMATAACINRLVG